MGAGSYQKQSSFNTSYGQRGSEQVCIDAMLGLWRSGYDGSACLQATLPAVRDNGEMIP
jgi:hypothetical protein